MERDPQCIFCKIIEGTIPSERIYEDEETLAIIDIFPAARGHTLVLPKQHAITLPELPENTAMAVMRTLRRISAAVISATGAEGFNVIQNNKEVAGQTVPHVHFHIVPRRKDDGLDLSFEKNLKYAEGEAHSVGEMIRGNLR